MQVLKFLMDLGAKRGACPHDLMCEIIWTKGQLSARQQEEKDGKRMPWGDRVKRLLDTSAFVSTDPNDSDTVAIFWAVLLGLFAGLREEEALQLKADDIDSMDGIDVLRIRSGEGQHLKRRTSRRNVPIHRDLIALGSLRFVEERRKAGHEWLFPEAERSAARGRLSGNFSKKFTRYRLKEGVYGPLRDIQSLRVDFNVRLKRPHKCPLDVRKRLLGQELHDVTEVNYDRRGLRSRSTRSGSTRSKSISLACVALGRMESCRKASDLRDASGGVGIRGREVPRKAVLRPLTGPAQQSPTAEFAAPRRHTAGEGGGEARCSDDEKAKQDDALRFSRHKGAGAPVQKRTGATAQGTASSSSRRAPCQRTAASRSGRAAGWPVTVSAETSVSRISSSSAKIRSACGRGRSTVDTLRKPLE